MSSDAIGWTWRHSPFKGTTLAVHLAVADSANDQHDYRFWLNQKTLAVKVRSSRQSVGVALSKLEGEGFLRRIRGGKSAGSSAEYRFVFKRHVPVVYESRRVADIEGDKKARTPAKKGGRGDKNPGTYPKVLPTDSIEPDSLELVAATAAKASQTLKALRAGERESLRAGAVGATE